MVGIPSVHTIGGQLGPSSSAAASTIVGFSQTNTWLPGAIDHSPSSARNDSHTGLVAIPVVTTRAIEAARAVA